MESDLSYKRIEADILNFDPVVAVQLPLSERVLDRLADIMFATDEILDMIGTQPYETDADTTRVIETSVRHVYDHVNDLMKKLTD